MSTTAKLVKALIEANAPDWMVVKAEAAEYHDFKSPSPTPCLDLIYDAGLAGLSDIANRAMDGEFEASREESDEWAREARKDPKMRAVLRVIEGLR